MADIATPLYSAEQIKVPEGLPDILKNYSKAVIRANPDDVIEWSAEYFQSLVNGDEAPAGSARGALKSTSRLPMLSPQGGEGDGEGKDEGEEVEEEMIRKEKIEKTKHLGQAIVARHKSENNDDVSISVEEIRELAMFADVEEDDLNDALQICSDSSTPLIDEFIVLSFALHAEDISEITSLIFSFFTSSDSDVLSCERFLHLFSFVQREDEGIEDEFMDQLKHELDVKYKDTGITYDNLSSSTLMTGVRGWKRIKAVFGL